MSHFQKCFSQVLGHEGVYDNDPNDTGGETVFGISRNNFPSWAGWTTVDNTKKVYQPSSREFRNTLINNNLFQEQIRSWYKTNFWDKFNLDSVEDYGLAYEIFDQSVNLGSGRTTKFIQQACNAFNYNGVFGEDLKVDGAVGPATRARLTLVGNNPKYTQAFRKALDGLQTTHYINLGNSNSTRSNYRKYMRGWINNRVGKFSEQGEVA